MQALCLMFQDDRGFWEVETPSLTLKCKMERGVVDKQTVCLAFRHEERLWEVKNPSLASNARWRSGSGWANPSVSHFKVREGCRRSKTHLLCRNTRQRWWWPMLCKVVVIGPSSSCFEWGGTHGDGRGCLAAGEGRGGGKIWRMWPQVTFFMLYPLCCIKMTGFNAMKGIFPSLRQILVVAESAY